MPLFIWAAEQIQDSIYAYYGICRIVNTSDTKTYPLDQVSTKLSQITFFRVAVTTASEEPTISIFKEGEL
jgi:hypothetical protein